QRQQDKGGRRADHDVERVGRVDGREQADRAGRGQDAGNIRGRDAREGSDAVRAAQPFADAEQGEREQPAERDAYAGTEQAGLDREADEEDGAERERQSANPYGPARAKLLLKRLTRTGRTWRSDRDDGFGFGSGRRDDFFRRLGGGLFGGKGSFRDFGRGDLALFRRGGGRIAQRWQDGGRGAHLQRMQARLEPLDAAACAKNHDECRNRHDGQGDEGENPECDQSV